MQIKRKYSESMEELKTIEIKPKYYLPAINLKTIKIPDLYDDDVERPHSKLDDEIIILR